MRGPRRMALTVGDPDAIARSEHDVVGAGSTHHRLMEVVAHRVMVGKIFEVRRVTLQHVVEAHGSRAFLRAQIVETRGLRFSIRSGANRGLDPGPQVVLASVRIAPTRARGAAVELLPHLVEAVHRAVVVRVVRMGFGRQLERTIGKTGGVWNTSVDVAMLQRSDSAGRQIDVVVVRQSVLVFLGGCYIRERRRTSTGKYRGK